MGELTSLPMFIEVVEAHREEAEVASVEGQDTVRRVPVGNGVRRHDEVAEFGHVADWLPSDKITGRKKFVREVSQAITE